MNNENTKTTEWVPFEKWGSFNRVKDGALLQAPMAADWKKGDPIKPDEEEMVGVEYLVGGEKEEGFLEAINERFGTDFTYSQFVQ